MGRLVINGEEIYELDEECMREKCKEQRPEKYFSETKEKRRTTFDTQKTQYNRLR